MYVGHVGDSAVVVGKQSQKCFEGKLVAHCVTVVCGILHNNDNNNQDDIYGAVIVAKPLREFTQFI